MRRLRQQRAERQMTLRELGEAVGVSAVTISRYENDEREPSIDMLKKLSGVLGISVDELIAEDEDDEAADD